MVMAQALFRSLKSAQPTRTIDVLAPAWSLPVVARMPEVRQGLAAETAHGEIGIGKRRRIGRKLRGSYDHAIVLPRSLKSALIPWFAGIPRRTGFRGESRFWLINDVRPFDKSVLDQTVKRYLALGQRDDASIAPEPFFPRLDVSEVEQQRLTQTLDLDRSRPVVGMMPGAEYGPAKCWPIEHFHALARSLNAAGYAVWILGSDKDAMAGQAIADGSGAVDLCGRTSLADVIDVLAMCAQVVSNDSGLMHVAAAVGCRVHAIYGSSSPAFTPPLTRRAEIHTLSLDCSPCFERRCPLGHLRCLRDLQPHAVMQKIVE